jgi:hypothetical protein
MHHDCQLYYLSDQTETWVETDVSKDAAHWMKPLTKWGQSSIVEVPANWHLDDWREHLLPNDVYLECRLIALINFPSQRRWFSISSSQMLYVSVMFVLRAVALTRVFVLAARLCGSARRREDVAGAV